LAIIAAAILRCNGRQEARTPDLRVATERWERAVSG
jgi:hypothetical protein